MATAKTARKATRGVAGKGSARGKAKAASTKTAAKVGARKTVKAASARKPAMKKKVAAKKPVAKKIATRKATTRKAATKKAVPKKAAPKKAATKKVATKRIAAKPASTKRATTKPPMPKRSATTRSATRAVPAQRAASGTRGKANGRSTNRATTKRTAAAPVAGTPSRLPKSFETEPAAVDVDRRWPATVGRAARDKTTASAPRKKDKKDETGMTQPPVRKQAGSSPATRPDTPLTPEQSAEQMRMLLEAKRERVRQGPTWPAANAHTGAIGGTSVAEASGMVEVEAPNSEIPQFSPETNFGTVGMHGRGNQGKRGQK